MVCIQVLLKIGFLFLFVKCTEGGRKKKTKSATALCLMPSNRYKDCTCLQVQCKKNTKIIDIDVTSGLTNDTCNDMDVCFGKTPSLISTTNQCYWQSSCSIPFPKDRMITHTGRNECIYIDQCCFYKESNFLKARHATCIKNKDIIDICTKRPKKQKKRGIIRSHPEYPWFYDNIIFNVTEPPCIWKYTLRKKALVVGVKTLDVCESDSLVLYTKTKEYQMNITDEYFVFKKADGFVEFKFSGSSSTDGCGGFIICFAEVKDKDLKKFKSAKDVCNKVTKKAKITEVGPGSNDCKKKKVKSSCCCKPDCEYCEELMAQLT